MSDESDIPILTDLIEEGTEIKMVDLGLDYNIDTEVEDPLHEDAEVDNVDPVFVAIDPFVDNPALEQTVRRILDEHMELAWQEIKLAIQHDLDRS